MSPYNVALHLPAGREPEVIALAQAIVSGLTGDAALYPFPLIAPAALTTLVSAYTTAKNTAVARKQFGS